MLQNAHLSAEEFTAIYAAFESLVVMVFLVLFIGMIFGLSVLVGAIEIVVIELDNR